MTEIKNSLEGLNNRFELEEERINRLEVWSKEIILSEEQKQKNKKI